MLHLLDVSAPTFVHLTSLPRQNSDRMWLEGSPNLLPSQPVPTEVRGGDTGSTPGIQHCKDGLTTTHAERTEVCTGQNL